MLGRRRYLDRELSCSRTERTTERQNEGSHYSASLDTRKQDQMSGVEMQDHLGMRRTS